ncbi:DUF2442 domain-containing protein [Polaromonas naphthalenivorans]|uniref:DUF2442 domain-containing protein n=1 Tax=Polaromonas naphthalenivorans (strain CJ2) TaxID=365044 RepID=A1VX28_POLNA|nr:DUF2442 domain-containing protein [Polaromonas naphthalenivorans]ABM40206.1 conserved hypothetical protein [Polaromonas naphthalenivorans CJ2]
MTTTVKVQSRFDEPVTQESLAKAIARGRQRGGEGIHATALQYLPQLQSLLFGFADHSAVALPVRNYPELAALDDAELQALTLGFGGSALCLETRDLHISIAGLVSASAPLMDMAATLIAARNGRATSSAKTAAARSNGRKGGRPRLATAL